LRRTSPFDHDRKMSADAGASAERPRIRSLLSAVVRDRDLRRVELAFLGFNMTEVATWIAILVYAYERGGATEAGLVSVIQLAPAAVVAPFAAYAGDRFRRDRVLFVDYLVQAVALAATAAALALHLPVPAVYAFAAVAASSLTFTRPAHNSLLPYVTDSPAHLTAANVVTSVAEGSGVMLGPLIGGILLAWSGPGAVFLAFASLTLVDALLVRRLRVDLSIAEPSARITARTVWHETVQGFRVLGRAREPRLLILVLSSGLVVWGLIDVLLVATAIDLLHMGSGGPGYLASAYGVGGIVGAAAASVLVGRRRLTLPLAAGGVVFGSPIAGIGAFPAVASAPVLLGLSGAGWGVTDVAGRTLLQRVSPDEVLARIFGILEGIAMVSLAVGSIAASLLVHAFGIRVALAITGAIVPVVLVVTGRRLLAIDREAAAPDPRLLELIRRIPIFAPLPAPAIERLLANLIRVDVRPGDVIIREGEPGNRFYVIDRGQVAVTAGGTPVGRRGAGEYVGEIALLRDVPRTATVTAVTEVTLYALERDVFLTAVTGHPRSRDVAEERIEHDLSALRERG
jgi:MFS family permease